MMGIHFVLFVDISEHLERASERALAAHTYTHVILTISDTIFDTSWQFFVQWKKFWTVTHSAAG
jgi:hypothetical protein